MANSYDVTRVPFQPKQQQIVNWNSCTAEEIINYEEEGQEVPEQYLKWAEEMSAAMNVQDDVTYEMANSGNGEDGQGGNAAQNFRTELSESGVSLKQQGKIFITESKDKEEETLASIEQMGPLLNQTQEIEEDAKNVADQTKTQLQELTDQINAVIDEKDNKPKFFQNRAERGELGGLQAVAGALANAASQKIEGMTGQVEDIQGTVNEGAVNSQLSQDYGTETVNIGAELLGKKDGFAGAMKDIGNILTFGLFGGGKRKVGREAVQQGTETVTVGQQGAQIAEQAAEANGVAIQGVGQAASSIGTPDTKGEDTGDNGGEEQTPEETAKSASAKPTEVKEGSATLAKTDPDKIVTDPNEIIKRKERLGLT